MRGCSGELEALLSSPGWSGVWSEAFDVFDSDIVYECDLFGVDFQDFDMQFTI